MGAPAAEEDAADRGAAEAAGLALPAINPMLDLEEACHAVSVDVVGHGGAPGADGRLENPDQGAAQAIEPSAR